MGAQEQTTWQGLTRLLKQRREGTKDGANIVLARFKPEPDGQVRRLKQNVLTRTAIALDCETDKKSGEIPPSLTEAIGRIEAHGWAAAVYTSHNHTQPAPRYRIVLPLTAEIPPGLPAVEVVANTLNLSGVLDKSKLGASSVFYLPSAEPGKLAQHNTAVVDGEPISAEWIQAEAGIILATRDKAQAGQRAEALAAAEARQAARVEAGLKPAESLIAAIRDRLDLEAELLRHGYARQGNKYLYPGSETGMAGVHILAGGDGVQRVYSHHSGDPLHEGNLPGWCAKACDAVDVVTILDFRGDRKAALHQLAKRFGIGDKPASDPGEPGDWAPYDEEAAPSPEPERGHEAPPQRIYVLTPEQCTREPAAPYVIKGILARGQHGAIIGLPGSAKSALGPYMGYRAALGLDVFGHRTRAVTVLYIAAEDGAGMKQRIRALFERMGDAPNFYLQPVPVDFLNQSGDSSDLAAIEKLITTLQPGLIFIDTIARSFPGLKENDPDQMGLVVRVARGFSLICNSAVVSIHHPPKDGETPRGHSVLNGDLDVTLNLVGTGSEIRRVTMGKNRNGPSDVSFSFQLLRHTLADAVDEDGDPITAPVADALDELPSNVNLAKEAKLRTGPALVLRELRGLLDTDGALVCPGTDFPTVRAVTRLALRLRLIDRGFFSEDLLCNALNKPAGLERKGYAFENNALSPLKRNGIVSFNRDWIWLL